MNPRRAAQWCVASACLGVALFAQGQTLFKVTAPDGTVTYTDRPPAASTGRVDPLRRGATPAAESGPVLPLALREPAARFPVVLYSIPDCAPCDRGRQLLRSRGVPYQERLARSDTDRDAWVRIVGSAEAPAMSVGSQILRGFSEGEWQATLDLAGYPRESRLPANHPPAAVTPLVERPPPAPVPLPAEPLVAPPPQPTIPLGSGGGIRF